MKKNYSIVLTAIILLLLPNKNLAQAPALGNAASFAVFTASGSFNSVGTTTVTGNVGTNAGTFNAFPPGTLNGSIYTADATSALAAADVVAAYNALSLTTCTTVLGVGIGNSQTLTPNVYCTGAAATLNGNLILDGQGNPNALFIIKVEGAFAIASNATVMLINGVSLCNVYWQVGGQFDLGSNSIFRGTVILNGAVNLLSGATLMGRVLSKAGAINLDNNLVSISAIPSTLTVTGGTICAGASFMLNSSGASTYTWNTGSHSSNISVSPSVTTTYSVSGMNTQGCVSSNTVSVYVNACTSVNNFEIESLKLKVYPNPTKGAFTIESEEAIQITVINSFGEVVALRTSTNKGKTEISLNGMSDGIYFIKAVSNNHQQIIKVIKQ